MIRGITPSVLGPSRLVLKGEAWRIIGLTGIRFRFCGDFYWFDHIPRAKILLK